MGDVQGNEDVQGDPGRMVMGQWKSRAFFPSSDNAIKLALLAVGTVLVWRLSSVLLLLFLAVLIATVLRGVADALAKRLHAPRQLMLAVVAIVLFAANIGLLYWIGPKLAGQATDLYRRLFSELQVLREQYGNTAIGHAVTGHLSNAQALEGRFATNALSFLGLTLDTIADLFAVIVISLYLAEAAGTYLDGAVRLVPIPHRTLARNVLEEMGRNLRLWLMGQIVDMVTVGGLTAIGLDLLGVPVPFALAVLAGLFTVVPYFGALAAAIPGVLVALTQSWMAAVWVVVIFVGCHVIEGYVVAPLVQERMVSMPPAIIIAAMAIAATLFGPLGIVLGTPLAVAGLVLVRRVYVERILGDREPETV